MTRSSDGSEGRLGQRGHALVSWQARASGARLTGSVLVMLVSNYGKVWIVLPPDGDAGLKPW